MYKKNEDDIASSFRETVQLDKFEIEREELDDRKSIKELLLRSKEILRTRIEDSMIKEPFRYR